MREPVFVPGFVGKDVMPHDLVVTVRNDFSGAPLAREDDGVNVATTVRPIALLPLLIPLTGILVAVCVLSQRASKWK